MESPFDKLYEGLDEDGAMELAMSIADQGDEAGFDADAIADAQSRIDAV